MNKISWRLRMSQAVKREASKISRKKGDKSLQMIKKL